MDTGFCATREPRPQRDATQLESKQHSNYYNNNNNNNNNVNYKPRNRYENGE